MRALAIAATGMSAQQQNIEVISNNIANINTTAFKRSRAEFTDLLYQTARLQGVSNRGRDAMVPQGAQVGLGVRMAAIRSLQMQGALAHTGNSFDLALNGHGWFQISSPDNETLYTRSGSFSPNLESTGGQSNQVVLVSLFVGAIFDRLILQMRSLEEGASAGMSIGRDCGSRHSAALWTARFLRAVLGASLGVKE
jgi:flagellar hook protein FlgE